MFIKIVWKDADGKAHVDFFATRGLATSVWGEIAGELSFVHISEDPEMIARTFLAHLPLYHVEIDITG